MDLPGDNITIQLYTKLHHHGFHVDEEQENEDKEGEGIERRWIKALRVFEELFPWVTKEINRTYKTLIGRMDA